MKTKILFVIDDLVLGGAEKILLSLIKGLNQEEFATAVLTLFSKDTLGRVFDDANVPCWNLGLTKISLPMAILKLRNYITDEKFDIVQFIRPVSRIVGSFATLGMDSIKVVSRYDSMISDEHPKLRVFEKLVMRRSDIVATPSYAVISNLQRYTDVPEKKRFVSHNGISLNGIHSRKSCERNHNGNGITIGTIGNVSWKKGYANGLMAIDIIRDKIPNLKYQIVGRLNGDSKVRCRIDDLNLAEHVDMMGEQENVFELLNEWDIYFQPSVTEGFGLSILEAMSCAKPIVAANVGGIPELIEHNVNGLLVDPEDSNDMAEALLNIVADSGSSVRLANNARKTAYAKFEIGKMIVDHERLYRNLVSNGL